MAEELQWGQARLILNLEAFARGYHQGRKYYFEERELSERVCQCLAATDLLWLIAAPDESGHYQLVDESRLLTELSEGIAPMLGMIVGYLSGPLQPESAEERQQRQAGLQALPQGAGSLSESRQAGASAS
ncbi:hypothetical protein [Thermogemmatispora onikobensis]|uniref:hypothetical protein n=1 Tax=Thermogemmatispora onikobensis TaxID=732234 RepID=UPI0008532D2E|nr:hypothetical protein [Thermogemmatispora onikobensis]